MRFIFRIVVIFVVLVVVAIAILLFMPGDRIARFAENQFETATGRSITIGGEVKTSIYPLLGVRTGPITIANAGWSKSGPLLQAEGLSIGVNLMSLFSGDVKIKKIEVIAPKILLEVAKDGRANWDMAKAGSGGQTAGQAAKIPAFSLGRALIKSGSLSFVDHASGSKYSLGDMDVDLRLPDFAGRGDLSLSARSNGQSVSLVTQVAKFGALLNGEISAMSTTVKAGGSTIKFNGKAGISPFAADGDLDANLADMAALFTAAGMKTPDLPKGMGRTAAVTGKITYAPEGSAHLRGGVIKLDHNVFSGGADLFPAKDRPLLKAQISAGALDFSTLAAGVDDAGKNVTTATGWPKDHIDVSGLAVVDADVTLVAKSIDLGTIKLDASSLKVKLDRSRAVFTLNQIKTYKGTITGQFVINGRGGLSVGGDLATKGISMQPLLKNLADYERLITVGDMRLKFLGVGNTMNAIMHSLSGSGSFKLDQGEILGLDLAGMLRNLDASYRGEGQKTVFDSISATFAMKNGVLTNDDLLFNAPFAKALGSGAIGIGKQTLDYRITPKVLAKADGSGGITVPVIISGTWSNPKFRPDLKALIDQQLADEKAALEAKLAAEKAAEKLRMEAKKAELEAKLAAKKAEALRRAQEKLSIELGAGESLEDAAKRKLEEEAKRGLEKLLGGN